MPRLSALWIALALCFATDLSLALDLPLKWVVHPSPRSGPNCWGTALAHVGLTRMIRFAHEDELSFWMRSPLCQRLESPQDLKFGDLVIVRERTTELHAAVYLAEGIAFEKQASNSSFPFRYRRVDLIHEDYNITETCRGEQDEKKALQCGRHSTYFRCLPIDEFVSNHKATIAPEFLNLKTRLDETEDLIGRISLSDVDSTAEGIQKLGTIRNTLQERLRKIELDNQEEMKGLMEHSQLPSENDFFLWESIQKRTRSLRLQMSIW